MDERGRAGAEPSLEEQMIDGLSACGWSKVGCSFAWVGPLAPLAHNRLACLQRKGWRRGFELLERTGAGEPIMEHAAAFILGREQQQELAGRRGRGGPCTGS